MRVQSQQEKQINHFILNIKKNIIQIKKKPEYNIRAFSIRYKN